MLDLPKSTFLKAQFCVRSCQRHNESTWMSAMLSLQWLLLLLLSRFSRVRFCATPRRQPTRLPRPWDSPGKNTGVGCHFLLQCTKVKSESEVAQSCLTLRPHGLQPTRLLRPWDFPGKNTGVGCHCLLRSAVDTCEKTRTHLCVCFF